MCIRDRMRGLFTSSFYLFQLLMLSLILHYLFAEFDGARFPCLKPLTRNKYAVWLLVQWQGFNFLQLFCFWCSMVSACMFFICGALGLLLHFFTNMFAVTALVGTSVAVYSNFTKIEAIVNLVHGEIAHAGTIMDFLKDGLMRRIIEISLAEKALARRTTKHSTWSPDPAEGESWFKGDTGDLRESFAAGFMAADADGGGDLTRGEFEAQFGSVTDAEWAQFDVNGDGSITLSEWQETKMARVQKGVLLIRSAFEHCVHKELAKHGFNKAKVIKLTFIGLISVIAILAIVYFAMKAANAFGAASALVSSGMSAAAIAFMNQPKKGSKIDPKLEKAIQSLNKALQKTVCTAVKDLCTMLRFFPKLLEILESSIDAAEKHLDLVNEGQPKSIRTNAKIMIKLTREALEQGLEANHRVGGACARHGNDDSDASSGKDKDSVEVS
eukprot:TRINITY_DN44106_c0_g1_i1.p1 TRINITY_DN44106_c0_g1~~TRINITY_DN44106_c0_g1_i1.p1  ORF type:complete len:441 (+),score=143.96 TRINITY_DN44106_c0_g1_i1:88-1410(+)